MMMTMIVNMKKLTIATHANFFKLVNHIPTKRNVLHTKYYYLAIFVT